MNVQPAQISLSLQPLAHHAAESMRAFFALILALALSLTVAAALTYPAWWLVSLIAPVPFHRVMHRMAMLVGVGVLVYLTRWLGVADRQSLGYALPRPLFVRQVLQAFLIGVLLMSPLVAMLYGLDLRIARPGFEWGGRLPGAIAQGLGTGFAVAFIEETFFRGVMLSAIRRESGAKLAVILTSLVYAVLHFLGGKINIPADQVHWSNGFDVLITLFDAYRDPLALVDSLAALFAVGVMLALVRLRTNAIAVCIGLHAGWVCVITVMRNASLRNPETPHSWLVGSYDGVIGWGACALLVCIIVVYWWGFADRNTVAERRDQAED